MRVLVINAGSSSLKYQLFDMTNNSVLSKGVCERIGIDGRIKHTAAGKPDFIEYVELPDHAAAIKEVTSLLISTEYGVITSMEDIDAVGHRVVHGAENFSESVLIDEKVINAISECASLAPLHNPPNLVGIEACRKVLGGDVPQVAVFDTAFHQTMSPKAYLYALPYEYYEKYKIRRYGFHGSSHRYVAARAAEMLGRPADDVKVITCHLGNGSSIAAVMGGKSVDTSMGFTPLEGVPMGTRCGNIDPATIEFIMERENITVSELMDILNKKSGVLGISGVSSDFRDLDEAAVGGNELARFALEKFAYSVKKYIGAYAAVMNGADALVFTAGIGENNPKMREMIATGLDYLGMTFDSEKNARRGVVGEISAPDSRNKILVIPTNEELVIATDTMKIVTGR